MAMNGCLCVLLKDGIDAGVVDDAADDVVDDAADDVVDEAVEVAAAVAAASEPAINIAVVDGGGGIHAFRFKLGFFGGGMNLLQSPEI
jgi:hypothetical protein